ncbi:hypothetical protein [Pseudomonas sp. NPDC089569]|uniref:hypothetical protein n=1 Tax=Pseudomonas sp. NPDC089569 TaxID=3390722 RepID=UPI003CFEA411
MARQLFHDSLLTRKFGFDQGYSHERQARIRIERREKKIRMKRQITQHLPTCGLALGGTAGELATTHAALKEKMLRSAYTDYFTRTERQGMREELGNISERYRSLTGHDLV